MGSALVVMCKGWAYGQSVGSTREAAAAAAGQLCERDGWGSTQPVHKLSADHGHIVKN